MSFDTLFAFSPFDLPSPEELNRRAQLRHEQNKACVSQPGRFIATSLSAWLRHARAASIPHVEANEVFRLPREVVINIDQPTAADVSVAAGMNSILARLPSTHMARLDPCAPFAIKYAMCHFGNVEQEDMRRIDLSDPRAFDIVCQFPADEVSVLARPWVDAMRIDSHPVEFRVFIQNSRLLGVASYYPQRALPETPEIHHLVRMCSNLSLELVDYLDTICQYPWMPGFESGTSGFEENAVSATLDFIVDKAGQVLLLEAGPPWGAGAHPCAFLGQEVKGVSLALLAGVKLS